MLFELKEASEHAKYIAHAASEWFRTNKRTKLHKLVSNSSKSGHFEQKLSAIWNSYVGERALKPLSLAARVNSAHAANAELLSAIQHLRGVPKGFISEFHQQRGGKVSEFDDLISAIENMQKFADFFIRPLTRGRKQDPIIERAAHKIADLYSELAERPFSKTFTTANDERRTFQSDGPEFVRVILNLIDSEIELRHVDTALRSYQPNRNDGRLS
jgi:hypothetical protein